MKPIILSLLILVASSCSHHYAVTVSQRMQLDRIDTVGKNLHLHLHPIGPLRSIYGKPFRTGDTLTMLTEKYIR